MDISRLMQALATMAVLALFATACGGGDNNDQAVVDAVAASLRADDETIPEEFDIECVASAMVSGLGGPETMEADYGLTAETIAAGQSLADLGLEHAAAVAVADGMMACDVSDMMAAQMTSEGMSTEDAQCLSGAIDQDALRDSFAATFMDELEGGLLAANAQAALFTSMANALDDCDIDPSELGS